MGARRWQHFVEGLSVSAQAMPMLPGPVTSLANSAFGVLVIAKAVAVIACVPQRGGWSSFSAVPALANRRPYLSVHEEIVGGPWRFAKAASFAGISRIDNVYHAGSNVQE